MRKELTALEYWLLDCVVEHSLPMDCVSAANHEEILNRRTHGADRDQLVESFTGLFERGWISTAPVGDESVTKALSSTQVERALFEEFDLPVQAQTYFHFTDAGARIWEEQSTPRWDRYLYWQSWCDVDADEVVCITGMNPDLVERAGRHHVQHYRDGSGPYHAVLREYVGDWEATYWKWLPNGYRHLGIGKVADTAPASCSAQSRLSMDPEFATKGYPVWYSNPYRV